MKKLFTLAAAALVALCAGAQVNSTRVELSPLNWDEANSNNVTWKFTGTDITLSNSGGKKHTHMDVNLDEYRTVKLMKVSKDVEFTLNIPEGHACVRLEFWGRTNSTDYNWSYLHHLTTPSLEEPVYMQTGGPTGDGRDIMDNEEIQKLTYPLSPYEDTVEKGPKVVFNDPLGWFSEVSFMYDGNNQVGTVLVVYTVPEADLENYKTETDASIVNTLSQFAMPTIVPSTRVELSPLHIDADNSDGATWKFKNTGVTLTNGNGKKYGSVDAYGDVNGDTCTISWMKMSKDVEFKINIPADSAVVRVEFWGVSNSGSAMNWAYLHSLTSPSVEQPIFSQTGGAAGDGRDIGVNGANDEIKTNCPHPFSPEAKNAETAPLAVFNDELGWFSELAFLYDGNNQVGANIVVYLVHQDQLADYKTKWDASIKSELDKPVIPDGIKVVPVARPFNPNAPIYNLAGQQVTKGYKGFVIQNGKKFILR